MEFNELVLNRQSCRNYSGKPVSEEDLLKIVETARLAPSACNSQPWLMHAVYTPEKVREIAKATQYLGSNKFTSKAGAFIVVEERLATLREGVTKVFGSQHFAKNDDGILIAHVVLSAKNMGIDSCILGMFDKEKIKKELSLDKKAEIVMVIALGYADESDVLREKIRKPIEEVVKFY